MTNTVGNGMNGYPVNSITKQLRQELRELQSDPALHFCHRFAILLECVMLGGVDKHWNEAHTLLDEYAQAQHKWREQMGEPYVSGFGKD